MRAFIAVWPPPEVVDSLAALHRPELDGLRWTSPEQWHVTLRFLGEVDADETAEAVGEIPRRWADSGPVIAEMGPATGHFGRRILYAPVSGLAALAAATVGATTGIGHPPDHRGFAGHITLARARHARGVEFGPFTGAPIAGRWVVHEITLVASHLGAGVDRGARYDIVRRLALPDA